MDRPKKSNRDRLRVSRRSGPRGPRRSASTCSARSSRPAPRGSARPASATPGTAGRAAAPTAASGSGTPAGRGGTTRPTCRRPRRRARSRTGPAATTAGRRAGRCPRGARPASSRTGRTWRTSPAAPALIFPTYPWGEMTARPLRGGFFSRGAGKRSMSDSGRPSLYFLSRARISGTRNVMSRCIRSGPAEQVLERGEQDLAGAVLHRDHACGVVLPALQDQPAAAVVRRVEQSRRSAGCARGSRPASRPCRPSRSTARATPRRPAWSPSGSPAAPARRPNSASSHLMNMGRESPISLMTAVGIRHIHQPL